MKLLDSNGSQQQLEFEKKCFIILYFGGRISKIEGLRKKINNEQTK